MFKISTSQDAIKDASGMSFIGKSGVYDVTINFASINVTKNNAEQFVFNVDYNGNQQTFYGPYYKKSDGTYNDAAVRLYTQLGVIAGLEDGDQFTISQETHKVGKDQKDQDFDVVEELSGLPVKLQVTAEYSLYNGEIQERFNIRSFFREDGATADEIVNDGEIGKRLAVVLEKYADNVTYRDDLTEEDVANWKAQRSSGKSAPAPAAKTTTKPKTGTLFGKK
mgnify:FL=1